MFLVLGAFGGRESQEMCPQRSSAGAECSLHPHKAFLVGSIHGPAGGRKTESSRSRKHLLSAHQCQALLDTWKARGSGRRGPDGASLHSTTVWSTVVEYGTLELGCYPLSQKAHTLPCESLFQPSWTQGHSFAVGLPWTFKLNLV